MNRADRRRWRAARTLEDLAELTAQWLEHHTPEHPGIEAQDLVLEHPGHQGKAGPSPETFEVPELVPALVRLNREVGLVTTQSQPGCAGRCDDGEWWEQRAAIEGFCDAGTLARLSYMLRLTPYELVAHRVKARWWHRARPGVCVTTRDGRNYLDFGWQLGAAHISQCFGDELSGEAFEVLRRSWQVTIYDPEPNRNTMWQDLGKAAS